MKSHFSIALLIETSSSYGRQILYGIQRFIQTENKQEWIAVIEERDVNAGVPGWIKHWSGDGIICRQTSDQLRDEILQQDIPFVDLTDRHEPSSFSSVRSDDEEIGRIAAEHLRERGLSHFAFCGFKGEAWSDRRRFGFQENLDSIDRAVYYSHESDWYALSRQQRDTEEVNLRKWLQDLPKPIGILACNDVCGKHLIDCCHKASINVPEMVAVVGVDNDELLCNFCHTPLSSVMPNAEGVGFRSAMILSKMLQSRGKKPAKAEHVRIPPLGVFARQSSDIVAVDDQDLARALKYIRDHACEGISVGNVVAHTNMSRSSLERRMRDFLGRTPQQEIRRVRLRHACALLAGSDLTVDVVALKCGYENPEYLHVVFKREIGMTPGEYRRAAGRC